jgi:hypothetical protein
MAKFKQLDVLILKDKESYTSGECLDTYGELVSPQPSAGVDPYLGGPATLGGGCILASSLLIAADLDGYIWQGDQAVDLDASTSVTLDLEKIDNYKVYFNPDTDAIDVSRVTVTMTNGDIHVVKESLTDFMKLMATTVG